MLKMMGFGPIFDGMGLINAIYSYADDIAIGFTSDRTMMPDPQNYAAALRQSFDELKAATAKGKAAAKSAPTKSAPAKAKPVKRPVSGKARAKAAPVAATTRKASKPVAKISTKAAKPPKKAQAKKKGKA
jgi:hypothetical protein